MPELQCERHCNDEIFMEVSVPIDKNHLNVANITSRKHLFMDLKPYMCLVNTCGVNEKQFATKSEWKAHLDLKHPSRQDSNDLKCPMCQDDKFTGDEHYSTHLAKHMEEVALTILPTNADSEDGTDADSGLASSEHSQCEENQDTESLTWPAPDNGENGHVAENVPGLSVSLPAANSAAMVSSGQELSSLSSSAKIPGSPRSNMLSGHAVQIEPTSRRWTVVMDPLSQIRGFTAFQKWFNQIENMFDSRTVLRDVEVALLHVAEVSLFMVFVV